MNEKTPKPKRPKRKISFGGWILLISLSIVLLVGSVFAFILYGAYSATGSIIVGNRFLFELEPKIKTSEITEIKDLIAAESFTVDSSLNLKSGTLRIMVQVKSELTNDELTAAVLKLKDDVHAILPIETYFTSTPDVKMYDLEIQVYNSLETTSTETFTYHYFVLVKNATMETWTVQDLATAANPTLREQLQAILNGTEVPAE